jgi:hypothetical protein
MEIERNNDCKFSHLWMCIPIIANRLKSYRNYIFMESTRQFAASGLVGCFLFILQPHPTS